MSKNDQAAESLFKFIDDIGSDVHSIVFLEVLFEEIYGKPISLSSPPRQDTDQNPHCFEQQQDIPTVSSEGHNPPKSA